MEALQLEGKIDTWMWPFCIINYSANLDSVISHLIIYCGKKMGICPLVSDTCWSVISIGVKFCLCLRSSR